MARSYHEQVDRDNTVKLRELTAALPPFVRTFFRGIEQTTSSRTRIAYAYDIHVFFEYLKENHFCPKNRCTCIILCLFFTKTGKTLTSVCVGLSVLTRFKVNIFPREQAPGQKYPPRILVSCETSQPS